VVAIHVHGHIVSREPRTLRRDLRSSTDRGEFPEIQPDADQHRFRSGRFDVVDDLGVIRLEHIQRREGVAGEQKPALRGQNLIPAEIHGDKGRMEREHCGHLRHSRGENAAGDWSATLARSGGRGVEPFGRRRILDGEIVGRQCYAGHVVGAGGRGAELGTVDSYEGDERSRERGLTSGRSDIGDGEVDLRLTGQLSRPRVIL